jgi:hypothetical protein
MGKFFTYYFRNLSPWEYREKGAPRGCIFLGLIFLTRRYMREKLLLFIARLKGFPMILREILYGMTLHEMDLELRKERGSLDHLFMLVVFGDLVGLPLLPLYYSMRLLPYIVPSIEKWKRSLLREKDLTDFVAADIG